MSSREDFLGWIASASSIGARRPRETDRSSRRTGRGWMAMYGLNMMRIAIELAVNDPAYEDVASKFWEHFVYIANALNRQRWREFG